MQPRACICGVWDVIMPDLNFPTVCLLSCNMYCDHEVPWLLRCPQGKDPVGLLLGARERRFRTQMAAAQERHARAMARLRERYCQAMAVQGVKVRG